MSAILTELPVDIAGWDRLFAESEDDYFFGRDPGELTRLTYQYWKILNPDLKGTVLDLGSGEGRDSVYFASKGFKVTAVEGAESGIRKTGRLAAESGVEVDSLIRADIRDYQIEPVFDIILARNILQFLGPKCMPTLERIQESTRVGGLNAVSVFTGEADIVHTLPGIRLFDRGELKRRYDGWRLLYYDEHILWREPIQDYLSFACIIAQKEKADPSFLGMTDWGRDDS